MKKQLSDEIKYALVEYMVDDDGYIITQCFDTPSLTNDHKILIYQGDGITILFCPKWKYFEIYGLGNWNNYEEFKMVERYYHDVYGMSYGGYLDYIKFIKFVNKLKNNDKESQKWS